MLDNGVYTSKNEDIIRAIIDDMIFELLVHGKNIIIDATNLKKADIERVERIVNDYNFNFKQSSVEDPSGVVIKSFMDIPIEECIKRDSKRSKPVGEEVIRNLYKTYIVEFLQ